MMEWLEILGWLAVAHCLADFPWQGAFLAMQKAKDMYLLAVHVTIWTGVCCVVLKYFGLLVPWKVLLLFAGHFGVDWWKILKTRRACCSELSEGDQSKHLLYIDQLAHGIQLLIVSV